MYILVQARTLALRPFLSSSDAPQVLRFFSCWRLASVEGNSPSSCFGSSLLSFALLVSVFRERSLPGDSSSSVLGACWCLLGPAALHISASRGCRIGGKSCFLDFLAGPVECEVGSAIDKSSRRPPPEVSALSFLPSPGSRSDAWNKHLDLQGASSCSYGEIRYMFLEIVRRTDFQPQAHSANPYARDQCHCNACQVETHETQV